MEIFLNSDIYTFIIIPLLIFLARVADVTIGTMRLIFVAKGYKFIAPILGFFEVIIWLLAMSQIMQHLDNWICYFAYGIGFATGNYVGILIEQKLSIGSVIIRVFPRVDITNLIEDLRINSFAVSAVDIHGKDGLNKMLFSIIKRKSIKKYVSIVLHHNPKAFYSLEDIKSISESAEINKNTKSVLGSFRIRKGK